MRIRNNTTNTTIVVAGAVTLQVSDKPLEPRNTLHRSLLYWLVFVTRKIASGFSHTNT
jgi:hypothetical protein